ncbi:MULTISPECIES: GNAT family N-acetyltransferase [Pacificibacter]|uniref:GNAT family N-acetyltransferase n=1 Tax=Pacificibacter TaxID=1042323 RepID=UPI001C0A1B5C|nr:MULTISPECIES: GNAT family N-acetyltransferase [Pacificibacter]MBU2936173.1 GNAT family N-acetyltransferase [Pacificibacter marinus]MDO6614977.1 GNAT family N-acetyltransferase [Pacificibacter sp. 1_MG-2023]
MRYHIRKAGPLDARALAELLNEIIAVGGTTAYVHDKTADDLAARMHMTGAVWLLAEDDTGRVMGFQWIEPSPKAADVADIASFVRIGGTGLGVGSKLFTAMCKAAKDIGYRAIDAIIRADNSGGLAYYQSRGFETFKVIKDTELDDGTRVDKIWKRYDLR